MYSLEQDTVICGEDEVFSADLTNAATSDPAYSNTPPVDRKTKVTASQTSVTADDMGLLEAMSNPSSTTEEQRSVEMDSSREGREAASILSSTSGTVRRRRVTTTSKKEGDPNPPESSQGLQVDVDTGKKDEVDDESKGKDKMKSVNSESSSQEVSPWRKWLESTATGLIKNASEKGATAMEVLASATNSTSFRKRRKKGGAKGAPLPLGATVDTKGVGTVFVNVGSAFRVRSITIELPKETYACGMLDKRRRCRGRRHICGGGTFIGSART